MIAARSWTPSIRRHPTTSLPQASPLHEKLLTPYDTALIRARDELEITRRGDLNLHVTIVPTILIRLSGLAVSLQVSVLCRGEIGAFETTI